MNMLGQTGLHTRTLSHRHAHTEKKENREMSEYDQNIV